MQNRTAKFVSAIFASLLAAIALTTVSHGAEPAADECLSGPKGQTPHGSHWYYRVDRASKRHCWYIGEEREKLSRAAPQNSASTANPVSPRKETAAQRPIADARAELPSPQTRVEETSVPTRQWSPATTANAASVENSQPANAWDVNAQPSVVTSRWPEPSGVSSSANPAPTTGNSGAPVHSNPAAAPPPAVSAVTFAAADPASERQSRSPPLPFILLCGAT